MATFFKGFLAALLGGAVSGAAAVLTTGQPITGKTVGFSAAAGAGSVKSSAGT